MSDTGSIIELYDGWFKSVAADIRAQNYSVPNDAATWLEEHGATLRLLAGLILQRAARPTSEGSPQ